MSNYKLKSYLLALSLSISLFSCSSDSKDDENSIDSIVGKWLVITENDYFCGTHDIAVDRETDPNQTTVYYADGTWEDFENEKPDGGKGTWENLGDGIYSIYYDYAEKITDSIEIEFVDKGDTMRFGLDDPCFSVSEGNGGYYTYRVYTRQ